MRVKAPHCVVTFQTTTQAMAFETIAKQEGLNGRLIPLPRAIGAGCGLAWKEVSEATDQLKHVIEVHQLAYDALHEVII